MGAPGHHKDPVELWLLADPTQGKCPLGLFYRKALQATVADSLGLCGKGSAAVWPVT